MIRGRGVGRGVLVCHAPFTIVSGLESQTSFRRLRVGTARGLGLRLGLRLGLGLGLDRGVEKRVP